MLLLEPFGFGEDKIFGSEGFMILDQENNYIGFFEKGKNYVDLSLNLSEVSSPDQYSMSFYVLDYFKTKKLVSVLYKI